MKISQLITCIVLVALVVVLGSVYLGFRFLVIHEFNQIERDSMERNLVRVHQAYLQELNQLDVITKDWAEWDVTYEYLASKKSPYGAKNFNPQVFDTLRVDVIAYFDREKQFYGGASLENGQVVPIPSQLIDELGRFVASRTTSAASSGLWSYKKRYYFLSKMPVLTSQGKGPSNGYLVFLKAFDQTVTSHLQKSMAITARFYRGSTLNSSSPELDMLLRLQSTDQQVVILDESIVGYTLFPAVGKELGILVEVVQPREYFAQGKRIVWIFCLYLTFGGVLYLLIVLCVFNRYVSARLKSLVTGLSWVGQKDDGLGRVQQDSRRDEIADVTRACNKMLDTIECMHNSQQESQLRQRRQNQALIDLAKSDLLMEQDLVSAAQRINEAVCRGTGAGRSSIWYGSEDQQQMLCPDLYYAPTSHHQQLKPLPYHFISGRYESAELSGSLIWNIEDSYERSRFNAMLQRLGLSPMEGAARISPIIYNEELFGFIIFELEEPMQHWCQDEEIFILSVCNYCSQTLATLKKLEHFKELEKNSSFDELTGLANRPRFYQLLKNQLLQAQQLDEQLALLFIGVDGIKEINASQGQSVADSVMSEVAKRMKSCLRSSDLLGRMGAGVFMAYLALPGTIEDVEFVAAKLIAAIGAPVEFADEEYYVTGSIGIAIYPTHSDSQEGLIDCADRAMSQLRQKAQNGICLYDPTLDEFS
ncbi:sensor domain-containing diguanylate cyclase [Dongshaea marina]|uniref:sensor domain-containing diguanylate cyclase n=1 Tax=Dongshaea marina TaxID=2047966 RepID=UPI000D3E05FD|nr:diguanylate cyclase [Dongshaea marina]